MVELALLDRVDVTDEPRRRRRRALPLALLILAVVTGLVGWWVADPGALGRNGNTSITHAPVGTTYVFGDVAYVQRDVTIESVRPRLVRGEATIEIMACRQMEAGLRIGATLADDLARSCSEVNPVDGAVVSPEGGWYLVAQVTRHSAGRVRIDGFDVTYREGIRRGAQHTGVDIVMRRSL